MSHHDLIRRYFAALASGDLSDDLFTDDMTAWTTSSGASAPKARYQGGVKLLQSLFPEGLAYEIDSITVEDDRAAVEARSHGVLSNGEVFDNAYVFVFRIRSGRIASVAEHFNPIPVREKIGPLMQAALSRAQGLSAAALASGAER